MALKGFCNNLVTIIIVYSREREIKGWKVSSHISTAAWWWKIVCDAVVAMSSSMLLWSNLKQMDFPPLKSTLFECLIRDSNVNLIDVVVVASDVIIATLTYSLHNCNLMPIAYWLIHECLNLHEWKSTFVKLLKFDALFSTSDRRSAEWISLDIGNLIKFPLEC